MSKKGSVSIEARNHLRWKAVLEQCNAASASASGDAANASTVQPTKGELSDEQARVLDAVRQGCNVFFTGPAGTGKSFTLHKIIEHFQSDTTGVEGVHVTAMTGIAATHIDGVTLHSFAGMGTEFGNINACLALFDCNPDARQRWIDARALIVDEISMMDESFLVALNHVACVLRRNTRPMGGIQLIVTGDFFQLPPIHKETPQKSKAPPPVRIFKSAVWNQLFARENCFVLQRVFRQHGDAEFIELLHNARMGFLTNQQDAVLRSRVIGQNAATAVDYATGIRPTRIETRRALVDSENARRLAQLPSDEEHVFKALIDDRGGNRKEADDLRKNCMAPAELRLRIGAQVMLLKNLKPPALVNGSRGIVVNFNNGLPVVQFTNGIVLELPRDLWIKRRGNSKGTILATYEQVPLCLAWALTVHKSQGSTLDAVELDISSCWDAGQAYVGLSRCTSLAGLRLVNYKRNSIKADESVIEYYALLGDERAARRLQELRRSRGDDFSVVFERMREQQQKTQQNQPTMDKGVVIPPLSKRPKLADQVFGWKKK